MQSKSYFFNIFSCGVFQDFSQWFDLASDFWNKIWTCLGYILFCPVSSIVYTLTPASQYQTENPEYNLKYYSIKSSCNLGYYK